jgi:hypothetical protein
MALAVIVTGVLVLSAPTGVQVLWLFIAAVGASAAWYRARRASPEYRGQPGPP